MGGYPALSSLIDIYEEKTIKNRKLNKIKVFFTRELKYFGIRLNIASLECNRIIESYLPFLEWNIYQ